MNPHVWDDFPVELSLEKTLERLKLDEGRSQTLGVEDVFKTAAVLIHTQAIYGAACVSKRSLDKIEIDGIEFTSHVLAKNLERIERVFPYVLAIGDSLEKTARSSESISRRLVLETVIDLALGSGLEHVQRHISEQHGLETTSNNGSGSAGLAHRATEGTVLAPWSRQRHNRRHSDRESNDGAPEINLRNHLSDRGDLHQLPAVSEKQMPLKEGSFRRGFGRGVCLRSGS